MNLLEVKNITVEVAGKEILKNFSLNLPVGEIHAVMGPNGAGKSTLAAVLTGHPAFKVKEGSIDFDGKNLLEMPVHQRAKAGIFLAFQHPIAVPGLKISEYLKNLYAAHKGVEIGVREFRKICNELLASVGLPKNVLTRDLNEGFSGGEKKRFELLQLSLIEPKLIILDEIDSGLDVDALKAVETIISLAKKRGASVLVITHYKRLLDTVRPDVVHLLAGGSIMKSGNESLANEIDSKGYVPFTETLANVTT